MAEQKKGFWGTLGDILKDTKPRPQTTVRKSGSRPQPKKPCGGCGGK